MLVIRESVLKNYLNGLELEQLFEEIQSLSEAQSTMYSVTKESDENPEFDYICEMYDTFDEANNIFLEISKEEKHAYLSEEISVVLFENDNMK